MKVSEFIEEGKQSKDLNKYFEEHIVLTYLPYADKIAMARKILSTSCYTNTEPKLFKIDSPLRKMLFMLSMIEQYTDISINWNNALKDFDDLSESGLISIINSISGSELKKCSSILDMMLDDLIMNERDLVSYIETKVDAMNIGLNALMEAFNSEELQKLIVDKLS